MQHSASPSFVARSNNRIHGHTHVYVNDPTQGYGLYIEWMLAQSE